MFHPWTTVASIVGQCTGSMRVVETTHTTLGRSLLDLAILNGRAFSVMGEPVRIENWSHTLLCVTSTKISDI